MFRSVLILGTMVPFIGYLCIFCPVYEHGLNTSPLCLDFERFKCRPSQGTFKFRRFYSGYQMLFEILTIHKPVLILPFVRYWYRHCTAKMWNWILVDFCTSLNSCFKFDGCLLLLIDGVADVVVPEANSEKDADRSDITSHKFDPKLTSSVTLCRHPSLTLQV